MRSLIVAPPLTMSGGRGMSEHGDRRVTGGPDHEQPLLAAAVDAEALYLHERGRPEAYLRAEEPVEIRR
jgi:hypothetical protein